MPRIVKQGGTTRLSSKHQVTIPAAVLVESGLRAGDRIVVAGGGPGTVILQRVEDLVEEYAGALTGRIDRKALELLDSEWD